MRIGITPPLSPDSASDRATDPSLVAVADMSMEHHRLHVAMTSELRHRSDNVTTLQLVGCEGMLVYI